MALGNGAPDVLASISASGSEGGGMFFAVGSLVGSGLFVTGVVSSIVMISSPTPVKVLGINLVRDIVFYLISLGVLLLAAVVGELNIYFAIAFFAIYAIFVIVVVIMDKLEIRAQEDDAPAGLRATFRETHKGGNAFFYVDDDDKIVDIEVEKSDEDEDEVMESKFENILSISVNRPKEDSMSQDDERSGTISLDSENDDTWSYGINSSSHLSQNYSQPMVPKVGDLVVVGNNTGSNNKNGNTIDLNYKIETTKIEKTGNLNEFIIEDHVSEVETLRVTDKEGIQPKGRVRKRVHRTKHKIVWSMLKMKKFLKKGIQAEQSWDEMGIFSKILYVFIDAPIDFIRRLTIPPPDGEAWDRRIATVMPFFSFFFVYVALGLIDFRNVPHFSFWICQGIALVLSIII